MVNVCPHGAWRWQDTGFFIQQPRLWSQSLFPIWVLHPWHSCYLHQNHPYIPFHQCTGLFVHILPSIWNDTSILLLATFLSFFLEEGIVASQCFTTKRISYMHTCIPSLLNFPPSPPYLPRSSQSNELTSYGCTFKFSKQCWNIALFLFFKNSVKKKSKAF